MCASISSPFSQSVPHSAQRPRNFADASRDPLVVLVTLQQHRPSSQQFTARFDLTEQDLFEIAKLCAAKNNVLTAENIECFGLPEAANFEIALICCSGRECTAPAFFIRNFGLSQEEDRLRVAMACAAQSAWATAKNIANFGLPRDEDRLRVAMACVARCGRTTGENIAHFELSQEEDRFRVAMACAAQCGRTTAGNIANFGLSQEEHRLQVAMACAALNTEATIEDIENFALSQQKNRLKLAVACAAHNAWATAENIASFELSQEKDRLEVAAACAKNSAMDTARCIDNFALTAEHCTQILILTVTNDLQALRYLDEGHPIGNFARLYLGLLDVYGFDPETYIPQLLHVPFAREIITDDLRDSLQTMEPPERKRVAVECATVAVFIWSSRLSEGQRAWLSEQRTLSDILALRAPHLRSCLLKVAEEVARASPDHFAQTPDDLPPLVRLVLARLQAQGVDLSSLRLPARTLQDGVRLTPFLESLIALADNEGLSSVQKTAIIGAFGDDPLGAARDLLIIFQCGQVGLLQEQPERSLAVLAEKAFQEVLPLPEVVPNFGKSYEREFSGSYGTALHIFAAQLSSHPRYSPERRFLGQFVHSVLTGTYFADRYDLAKNPHLQFLEKRRPGLIATWQEDSRESLDKVLRVAAPAAAASSASMLEWLRVKLLTDRHMGLGLCPFVRHFLQDADVTEEREALIARRKALSIAQSRCRQEEPIPTELSEEVGQINLQFALVKLARLSDPKQILPVLKEIEPLVRGSEFHNDVQAQIQLLQQTHRTSDLFVSVTDDPRYLLVCGTDVGGSCQRVSGDPSLSRGLIGYLWNGQDRLVAVTDGKGSLVARRVLRLLWDEKGKRPVLYAERRYSNDDNPSIDVGIMASAREVAARLLCPLTANHGDVSYPHPIQSLGGAVPREYVDGVGGIVEGPYTIRGAKLIWEPL